MPKLRHRRAALSRNIGSNSNLRPRCRLGFVEWWWLGEAGGPTSAGAQGSGLSRVLEQLRENLVGTTPGGILGGGLAELVDRFKQSGYGETAESWVASGPNRPVTPAELQQAIGPDVLETLSRQTGLSHQELLARLSRELPEAVDKYTPQGRLPTEASRYAAKLT